MSKPSVAFAERVTAFPPSPTTSAVSSAPRVVKSKSSTINSMLIGLMGIIFGLGIMYLLSRVMHTSRRLTVMERQAKQQHMRTEDVEAQVQFLQLQLATASPVQAQTQAPSPKPAQPPATPLPVKQPAAESANAVKPAVPNLPIPLSFPPVTWLELSPDMLPDMLPGFEALFCDAGVCGTAAKSDCVVEEVVEDVDKETKKEESKPASSIETQQPTPIAATSSEGSSSESESEEKAEPVKPDVRSTRGRGGGRGGGAGRGRKRAD